MTSRVLCVWKDIHDRGAINAYAVNHGWTIGSKPGKPNMGLPSESWVNGHTETPQQAATRLGAGDSLLVMSLADVSSKPSEQRAFIQYCAGQGILLHIHSLGGTIDNHMVTLRDAWRSFDPLEKELSDTLALMERERAEMVAEAEALERAVMSKVVTLWGLPKAIAEYREEEPPPVGHFIKEKREALGLTQQQVADRIGASKAQVSRAELTGKAEKLQEILELVSPTKQMEQTNG
jgi:DNA-binding transcriptional regulator YiaG